MPKKVEKKSKLKMENVLVSVVAALAIFLVVLAVISTTNIGDVSDKPFEIGRVASSAGDSDLELATETPLTIEYARTDSKIDYGVDDDLYRFTITTSEETSLNYIVFYEDAYDIRYRKDELYRVDTEEPELVDTNPEYSAHYFDAKTNNYFGVSRINFDEPFLFEPDVTYEFVRKAEITDTNFADKGFMEIGIVQPVVTKKLKLND